MSRRVKGPDGVIREFPDDATDAEISAALDTKAAPSSSWLDSLKDFASEAFAGLNPKAIAQGVTQAVTHPIDTGSAMLHNQGALEQKAEEAFKKGDYATGVRHAINYLLPIIGPRLDQAGDFMQQGEVAKGLGATADVAIQTMGPKALEQAGSVRVPAVAANKNATVADAVAFGQQHGVPVDAATASGSPFVRGVQKLADESLVGSVRGQQAQAAQARGLATLGDQLAAKASPTATTAEQAGQAVRSGVTTTMRNASAEADAAYGDLRQFEQTRGWIPVDVTQAKPALKPIYDALLRERELNGVMMGDKAKALNALDKIMHAPDVIPLSDIDPVVSDLKAFARSSDPALRSVGQGNVAQMIKVLDGQIRQAATQAGPQAINALTRGRQATIAKYAAADVLDKLAEEPVRTTGRLTAPKDSAIDLVRAVEQQAPGSLPLVGRSVLDGLLDKATEAGGFAHADKLYADWQKLGDETKSLLFKDPAYVQDLDRFFLLAKKMAENPNPSGTALTAAKGGELALIFADPIKGGAVSLGGAAISTLLHSQTGVKLLTRGLVIPTGAKAASAAYLTQLARALGDAGVTMPGLTPAYATQGAPNR